jgi:hypothetical protein
MRDSDTIELGLFGTWPIAAVYDGGGGSGWSPEECRAEARTVFLETKTGDPQEALRSLLNDMTREMRAEFDYFRSLRAAAETSGEAAAEQESDGVAARLARADVKAAVDAMSLIVRTLEKVDALQRQIARDRDNESQRHADAPDYEEAKKRLLAIVEQRVSDRVQASLAERDPGQVLAGASGDDAGTTAGTKIATGPPGPCPDD